MASWSSSESTYACLRFDALLPQALDSPSRLLVGADLVLEDGIDVAVTGNDELDDELDDDDADEPRMLLGAFSSILTLTDDEAAAIAYDDDAVELVDVATASGTCATRSLRKSNRSSRSIALRK